MRFILNILTLFICCSPLTAWERQNYFSDCCASFNGCYVGVSGGIATVMAEDKIMPTAIFTVLGEEVLVNNTKVNIYNIKPWGEIFAGWGQQCGCFYWGGRLGINFCSFHPQLNTSFANLDPIDEGSSFLEDSLTTRLWSAEYTFDFKPGWILTSRGMLFGIIGTAINKEKLEGKSQFTKLPGPSSPSSAFSEIDVRKEKICAGIRAGLGFEYMMSRCCSINVAYVYTRYWKISDNASVTALDSDLAPFTHSANFQTQASKQVTSIGLTYYF